MGYRDARVGRHRDGGGDSRDDFERNGGRRERLRLFAAAAEQERIAAFQPNDLLPGPRFFDQQLVDFILLQGVRAGLFPGVNYFHRFRRPLQHLRVAEVIVNHHFRPLDHFPGAQGDQSQIARSRADQITPSQFFLIRHKVA